MLHNSGLLWLEPPCLNVLLVCPCEAPVPALRLCAGAQSWPQLIFAPPQADQPAPPPLCRQPRPLAPVTSRLSPQWPQAQCRLVTGGCQAAKACAVAGCGAQRRRISVASSPALSLVPGASNEPGLGGQRRVNGFGHPFRRWPASGVAAQAEITWWRAAVSVRAARARARSCAPTTVQRVSMDRPPASKAIAAEGQTLTCCALPFPPQAAMPHSLCRRSCCAARASCTTVGAQCSKNARVGCTAHGVDVRQCTNPTLLLALERTPRVLAPMLLHLGRQACLPCICAATRPIPAPPPHASMPAGRSRY